MLAVRHGRDAVVLPLTVVRRLRVVSFSAFGVPMVALYERGVASALDRQRIDQSTDVGPAVLYDARVAGRIRTLRPTSTTGHFASADNTIWTSPPAPSPGP